MNCLNTDWEQAIRAVRCSINHCLIKDRHKLFLRLNKIKRGRSTENTRQYLLQSLIKDIEHSTSVVQRRKQNLPVVTFPDELPICNSREQIEQLIIQHPVVIIAGETGSGKTTQLPKMCISIGRGIAGLIGHTQPRRIAARSIATRISQELKTELGDVVGYKVRFNDTIKANANIKLMTDGILLAEIQSDRYLNQYDTIIIDEAHERNLNIDFLLGYLKQLLPKRPDLKLIVTSATIDTERFSTHFNNAPVIEVSGRTYPVEVRYRPIDIDTTVNATEDESQHNTQQPSPHINVAQKRDPQQVLLEAINELEIARCTGDILVFLSGEREIRETDTFLKKCLDTQHIELLMLFSRLSAKDQQRIFQTSAKRRIILSTNVAETSLTVPGIKYVIDTGTARINHYSYRSKVERLPVEKISQSSANQRKGRCGRISNGVCIRLYTEEDFRSRPLYSVPEIKRVNLASVILRMKSLNLAHIADFPFLDSPDNRYVKDGFKLLNELGAIDHEQKLTKIGRELSRLPIDPKMGRMLLASMKENCVQEILIITSALSIQDPRERPHGHQAAADQQHALFHKNIDDRENNKANHRRNDKVSPINTTNIDAAQVQKTNKQNTVIRSDFLIFVYLWQAYKKQSKQGSNNQLRKWCQSHYISYLRMREWQDVYLQLKKMVVEAGAKINQVAAGYDEIHKALLPGVLGNLGFKVEKQEFEGARHIRFHVFPGSIVHNSPPKWLMAVNLLETSRLYAHVCAKIEPQWVENAAQHLVKRCYNEVHWDEKAAQVSALESVTLYGLTIIANRKINYGPIAPKESREIFIRAALVEQRVKCDAAFYRHNCDLIKQTKNDEEKERRRDILITDDKIYAFYDSKIPVGIFNVPLLLTWLKNLTEDDTRSLYMSRSFLINEAAHEDNEILFPKQLQLDKLALPLTYRFEPGHEYDGVTVELHEFLLNQIPAYKFEWLVPGLLEEKIAALIKSLPKKFRRSFVPAPNFAKACVEAIQPYETPMIETVSKHLFKMTGLMVPSDVWNITQLPGHLLMNFNIIDSNGKTIRTGKDLAILKGMKPRIESQVSAFTAVNVAKIERHGMTHWAVEEIPAVYEMQQQGHTIVAYPALVDNQNSVAITLFDTPVAAHKSHIEGLYRLFSIEARKQLMYCIKNIPNINMLCAAFTALGSCEKLKTDILRSAILNVFFYNEDDIRTRESYENHKRHALEHLISQANTLSELITEILGQYKSVMRRLNQSTPIAWIEAINDIHTQLKYLIHPEFITQTPNQWLRRLPVYLQAIEARLTKLEQSPQTDRLRQQQVTGHWQQYLQLADKNISKVKNTAAFTQYRWMIEEMRVSLFSQRLKTAMPVSIERLQKQLELVLRVCKETT
ncbi:MAG: ATP-dependent RNA helicase HrpA [Gammaproteobacteria bacterium]|nr:ATP-dependent RNA helicase HrpA [Gammaproteobacteria bacterium]